MKKWLFFILGIGFLHRLVFIGARQLWTDELMQARIIQFASLKEILLRLRDGMDLASPLDFLVQRGFTLLLGDAPWALRLPALLFGTAAIWIFYRLARFLFDERIALYSTFLFAFFPLACHYSQEARPYSLLLFLSIVSFDVLFRRVYGGKGSWLGWLPVAGISALLLYTSYLGVLILISQWIALAISTVWKLEFGVRRAVAGLVPAPGKSCWEQLLAFTLAAAAAGALFYPWMLFTWDRPNLSPASEIADPKIILRLIKGLGDNSYPVAGLLLIGALTGAVALLRQRRRGEFAWLATWLLVPIPVILGVELWAGYFFAIRHILHITPPLVLFAGFGLSHVGERGTLLPKLPYRLSFPAVVFAALLMAGSVWIAYVHTHHEPADWRGVAGFLNETVQAGDSLSMPGIFPLLEYYYPGLGAYRASDLDPGTGGLAAAGVRRRIVVCYDKMSPDPCAGFRTPAAQDNAWLKSSFKGFSLFVRGQ